MLKNSECSTLDVPKLVTLTMLAALFWTGLPLLAQETTPVEIETGETMYTLLVKGGWLMWPIGLCSFIVVMFAIERLVSLRAARTIPAGQLQEIIERTSATRDKQALQAIAAETEESRTILAAVLAPGVRKAHLGRVACEEFLAEAAAKEVGFLKRKLRPFSVVETLAPLLGLLGTVYGMIECFENAASTDAASRSESLARGIYGALVTTAAGLSVAIPAKVLYHYFEGWVDRVIDRLETAANEFVETVFGDQDEPVVHRAESHPRKHHAAAVGETPETDPNVETPKVSAAKRKEMIAKAMKRRSGSDS